MDDTKTDGGSLRRRIGRRLAALLYAGTGLVPIAVADDLPAERRVARWFAAHPRAPWHIGTGVVAIVLYAVAAPLEATVYGGHVLTALFATAALYGSLVVSVRLPVIAAVVFAAAAFLPRLAYTAPSAAPWPWTVTAIIAFAVLVLVATTCHGTPLGLVAYLVPGVLVSALTVFFFDSRSLADSIVALAVGVLALLVGALLRARLLVGAELSHEREVNQTELERRQLAEERQRIAREMHDVVAHGLSLIQVQATSARYRIPDVPEPAAAEFDDIAASARSALVEMRRLLSVLRGDDEPAEHAPQPGLGDVPRLVEESRRAGADIGLVGPPEDEVAQAAGLAAFRIAQEAVSNAIRHSPGARIDVAVRVDGGRLFIEVHNAAPASPPAQPTGSGHGIIGMRERATLLGGSLSTGPTASGGYLVVAALPLSDDRGADARQAGGPGEVTATA